MATKETKKDPSEYTVEEKLKKDEDDLEREAQLNGEDYQRRTFNKEEIDRELLDRLSEDQRAAYELVTMAAKSGTAETPLALLPVNGIFMP